MLDLGALVPLKRFMLASDDEVKKEAGWCVSNICAGSQHQIGMLQKAGFFPIIVNQMSQSHKVQKEAVWCVISLTSNANTDQVCSRFHENFIHSNNIFVV